MLLLFLPAFAQFRDLATTDDGEQFYFSSALRVKGTEDLTSEKILRYVDSHFETFRQIPCEIQLSRSNHCEQTEPQVSGDGRVVANTANGWCSGGSRCIGYVQFSGAIAGADVPAGATLWNGYVRMSRNARFIARLGADTWIPYNPSNEFIDLVQGTYARLPQLSLLGTQAISDDGSLLARDSTGPLLWRSGTQQRLHFSSIPQMGGAQLSANGRLIVYEGLVEGRCQAVSYEVATEREIPIGAIPCRQAIRRSILSLSNDGSLVLYPSPEPSGASERLMLQSTAGGTARVLMQSASGISEAVLSGDGSVAYAATPAGGLLKIRVSTGETRNSQSRLWYSQATTKSRRVCAWNFRGNLSKRRA